MLNLAICQPGGAKAKDAENCLQSPHHPGAPGDVLILWPPSSFGSTNFTQPVHCNQSWPCFAFEKRSVGELSHTEFGHRPSAMLHVEMLSLAKSFELLVCLRQLQIQSVLPSPKTVLFETPGSTLGIFFRSTASTVQNRFHYFGSTSQLRASSEDSRLFR